MIQGQRIADNERRELSQKGRERGEEKIKGMFE